MKPVRRHRFPRPQSAFTLIEIMLALLIVSMLSVFAYPSYREVRLKTARAEGRAALMQLMQQQERHYSLHRRYLRFSAGDAAAPFRRHSGATERASAYRLEASFCPQHGDAQECILLRAVPAPGFGDPHCGVLTLGSDGSQGAAGKTGADSPAGCW
ncbi:MAG: N-terminal cleavage protein [Herbaspirillum sp.]|jgi:type IV pilus assembly protein PilE|nr:N-terminal cleavage protein [Herbaspirillum sp.]